MFYAKKGKKVASKKKEKLPTVRCPYCNVVILNLGGTWCAKTEWVNIKCSKCDKPVLLSATSAEKREDTPLLCTKCFRVLERIQCKIKGRKGLVCPECYSSITGKIAPKVIEGSGSLATVIAYHMAQVKKCVDCEQYVRNPNNQEGACVRNSELFVNNPTQACSFYKEKKMTEIPKRSRCVNCGGVFKTTLAVRGGAEPVCAMCRKKEPPKPTCTVCGEPIKGGEYSYKDGTLCFGCHRVRKDAIFKEDEVVTENPIHERYLIVEGRGAWACSNVYTHDFSNRENAFKFMDRYRPDTCKMFRVSSTAPIMLEELSLGYDIKVTSTHEIKEHK